VERGVGSNTDEWLRRQICRVGVALFAPQPLSTQLWPIEGVELVQVSVPVFCVPESDELARREQLAVTISSASALLLQPLPLLLPPSFIN
jgi:hypothetical protein